ncbi:MAG: IS66 family transposase [Blastomonas fulva]|uniref:IS66 family transposase n=1 Tax=Blastomonas fulva TaxID=1550728 RepID=UPI003F6F5C42
MPLSAKRRAAVLRYSDNVLLEISNNLVENAPRGVQLGLGNWLFFGSPEHSGHLNDGD